MIIHPVDQGTDEWQRLRCGRVTASRFGDLINSSPVWVVCRADGEVASRHRSEEAAKKGAAKLETRMLKAGEPGANGVRVEMIYEPSAAATAYLYELAAEYWTGAPADGYESQAMLRGRYLEDEAVAWYEMHCDLTSDPGGVVTTDDGKASCSPDRLMYITGDHSAPVGGAEIKNPLAKGHLQYRYGQRTVDTAHYNQVQGCIWICEVEWWDVINYHPDGVPTVHRVERDPAWQEAFAGHLQTFIADLDALLDRMRADGYRLAIDTWEDRQK